MKEFPVSPFRAIRLREPVFEVVGGLEPPWKVLQTRA